jgi:chromate reductase, NAD(P)H dehydrogenase (quinone)
MQLNQARILVINGSLGGSQGNTARALAPFLELLRRTCEVDEVQLAECATQSNWDARHLLKSQVESASAFVFATGTYWDSWGSPLQKFFEEVTNWEATELWLGKPAAALVTMHSVGGKEVLSRLQGVLGTLGVMIPPMSGMAYSLANQLALENETSDAKDFQADLWQLGDLRLIAENLLTALELQGLQRKSGRQWKSWPVDERDARRVWLRASSGELGDLEDA